MLDPAVVALAKQLPEIEGRLAAAQARRREFERAEVVRQAEVAQALAKLHGEERLVEAEMRRAGVARERVKAALPHGLLGALDRAEAATRAHAPAVDRARREAEAAAAALRARSGDAVAPKEELRALTERAALADAEHSAARRRADELGVGVRVAVEAVEATLAKLLTPPAAPKGAAKR